MPATGHSFDLKQNVFRDDRRDVLAWSFSSLATGTYLLYILVKCYLVGFLRLALRALGRGQP